jgi:transcription termination factor Rho
LSGEQQLERSVLDAKERDELRAIADAMGVKAPARVSKANLVTQILRAAGVEVEENGTASRSRSARARSENNGEAGDDAVVEAAAGDPPPVAQATPSPDAAPASVPEAASEPAATASPEGAPPAPAPAPDADPGDAAVAPAAAQAQPSQQQPHQRDGGRQQQQQQQQRDRNRDAGPGNRQFDAAGEPGNRRNRRRRGRDRERGPLAGGAPERDLPGMGQETQYAGEPVPVSGLLDLRDEGFGFLRTNGYLASAKDVYVSISQVRRFALRKGDHVEGASRPAGSNEKYPALLRIDTVSGMTPDEARARPRFEDLTPLFPDQKLRLERAGEPSNMTARIVDLLSPIGKGQRGLIVSPPKAGKTTVMKQIAHSIEANNPEVHLMVLLVDERPEEVTDMKRSVQGEVVASTFDRPSDEHTQVAELAIERAKRLVEMGKDVVIILDGITRLARAYNLAAPASGRILSGGVDSGALYPPKKFFGSARNIEEGGSLTILATALVETGSRMDEVIFEEFKGTGNMELRLDRKLSERRVYPAIDVNASSTRHEELLFDRSQLQQVWKLRRVLNALGSEGSAAAGLELLMDKIKTTASNDEFLAEIAKGPTPPV